MESKTDQTLFTVAAEFEVGFDEFIELDIPSEGLTLDGWNIKPLYHPTGMYACMYVCMYICIYVYN